MAAEELDAGLDALSRAAFEKSERERRWSVFEDVPWSRARRDPPKTLVGTAETFFCIHAALPDFLSRGLSGLSAHPAMRAFLMVYAYEKSRHPLALRMWLERTGARTSGDLIALEQRLSRRSSDVPFTTPRQMLFYGAVQEMATFVTYAKHREVAKSENDDCLRTIYDYAARDAFAHARFFEAATKLFSSEDRTGTLADMAFVLERFATPGETLLDDYEERMSVVREAGLDRDVFIQRVYAPLLKRLDVTRRDLALARGATPSERSFGAVV